MENEKDVTILPGKEDLEAWLFLLVIVIILLLWDVVKACMRRAFWFPGQGLVLSFLIFQLLPFVDYSNISVYSGSSYEKKEVSAILVTNQLVIDSGRLMMYVLTAYLLPGMARSGSISDASTLAVFVLPVAFRVVSQVPRVEKRNESLSALAASSEGFDRIISYLCSTILILAIIYLLWLLMRAIMVGRSIRRIMSQRIRSALSCCTPDVGHLPGRHKTKDHVLKCWIVVRFSQPDYVFARSGFCSMVCRIVTACIGLHVINWRHVLFTDNESLNSVTKRMLVQFVIVGQFAIVGIGWIVLFVRGVTSAMHRDISSGDYFKSVSIEDALTDLAAYFCIQEQKIRHFYSLLSGFKTRVIESVPGHWVQKLFQLFPGHWVQKLFQLFPGHWVLKLLQFFTAWFVSGHNDAEFEMYQDTLRILQIGEEMELSLWKANQQGLSRVQGKMEQGQQAVENRPTELTDLLQVRGEWVEQLLQDNNNSWKRTAVSLIHLMIYYYKVSDASAIENATVIEKAMQCYIQAWDYMHFVDGLNQEVKSLWQIDEEFESLQHTWKYREEDEMLERKINGPLNKLISGSDLERDRPQYCLHRTWTHIPKITEMNKIHWLQRVLAHVYYFCMTEDLNKAVLVKCSKLAEEGMEEEILDVAFLAAKAQGALDKASLEPRRPEGLPERPENPPERPEDPPERPESPLGRPGKPEGPPEGPTVQTSTSSHSPTAGGGPTGQASTSLHSPTVAGGKGQAELPNNTHGEMARDAGEDDSTDSDKKDDSTDSMDSTDPTDSTDPDKEKTL